MYMPGQSSAIKSHFPRENFPHNHGKKNSLTLRHRPMVQCAWCETVDYVHVRRLHELPIG